MFRHVVLMNWNNSMTPEELDRVRVAMTELGAQSSTVRSLTHGPDAGVRAGGSQYALVADFDDEQGWRDYSAHPAHDGLRSLLREKVASQTSCQFWTA